MNAPDGTPAPLVESDAVTSATSADPLINAEPSAPSATEDVIELILVSHRGPVRFDPDCHRGGGGLVTALRDLVRNATSTTWICAASTPTEIELASTAQSVAIAIDDSVVHQATSTGSSDSLERNDPTIANCHVRFVATAPSAHHKFYAVIANPMLWFIQHGLWDHTRSPMIGSHELDAWNHGYLTVNEAFADAIATELVDASPSAVIMVHDYHFYTLPASLRARAVQQLIHFFIHIPWPAADAWRTLRPTIRDAIVTGLLHCDLVAFHTDRYARNFLSTCADLLRLDVDWHARTVQFEGRQVAVRFYPISVDAQSLLHLADTKEVATHQAALEATRREFLILRVDRADPSKNILRGFHAYARLLELHPVLNERVTFLALLQPTREDVREYREYRQEIEQLVAEINQRFATLAWQPIDLRFVEDLGLAVAAYREFDVLMVNALADGMNLVAKEALIVNERDGVLALSELAGAHEELGAAAVTLYPFDIEQQAEALWDSLTMAPGERKARHVAGLDIVSTNNVAKWLRHQLDDLSDIARTR